LLAGWTTATLPFFPAYWPGALAFLAAALTVAAPRLGLAFALAVPVLPLGNIALGLAIVYGIAACAWFAAFWARPRAALLFVAGPLLAPLGLLALLPLAALPAGGPARRAAQALVAVLTAGVVAGLGGSALPVTGGAAPDLAVGGVAAPAAAASSLWDALAGSQPFLLEALARTGAAAAIGVCRRRGPWGGAVFGALVTALTLLADPGASALPLVAAAWAGALLLAVEPGQPQPLPDFLRRIGSGRVRLHLVHGS
jgi:hypothetical protein